MAAARFMPGVCGVLMSPCASNQITPSRDAPSMRAAS